MPTFTAITLDRLLEHGSQNPAIATRPTIPLAPLKLERRKIALRYPSPALYTTPEVTPLPDSPSSFSPSPYIIKRKHRNTPPLLPKSSSHNDVPASLQPPDPGAGILKSSSSQNDVPACEDGVAVGDRDGQEGSSFENGHESNSNLTVCDEPEPEKSGVADTEEGTEGDDLFDNHDSISLSSNTDVEDRSGKPGTPLVEFFDAYDELSSGSSAQSAYQDIEREMREVRLNLMTEIGRRKQAEDAIENVQNQWKSLRSQLAHVGLSLPALPTFIEENGQPNVLGEELSQHVVVSRFVARAIGRACSRSEVELEMVPVIEAKNFEIARLRDRLHYYEAANREMSQRNQETVEMARQQRHRRRTRHKWLLSSVGVAVGLGAAAVVWYLGYWPSYHDTDVSTDVSTNHDK